MIWHKAERRHHHPWCGVDICALGWGVIGHRATGDVMGWSRRPPWSAEMVMWVVKQRRQTGGVVKYRSVRYIILSLYWGDEFSILRLFVSLKFPFTTKIVEECQHSVRIYVRYISQKHENFRYWPNKSHDVAIETPTNHSSSRRDIVFHSEENNVGIVRRFVISKKGSVFKSH
jgi:hypothetical protein